MEGIQALEASKTQVIIDLPPGKKSIYCKWVFRVKYKSNGTIEHFKAHLDIHRDHQVEELYYNQLLPRAKMTSMHCFLSVAMAKGYELHQMY